MQPGTTGPIHFINLEYFFRLLYESRLGFAASSTPAVDLVGGIVSWILHVWNILGVVSFAFALAAFFVLAYSTVRLHQLREQEEHERWSTLEPKAADDALDHSRWAHVQSLIESGQDRDWREAIMEADIMLDDMLIERGYAGETLADRLKAVDRSRFKTVEDAWEAHKVRNQIAHEGSAFTLDEHLAYRTIKKFENVFREFGEI